MANMEAWVESLQVNQETGLSVTDVREAAVTAIKELQAGAEMRPMIIMRGRDGKTYNISAQVSTNDDEKDITLLTWLRAVECDAQSLLSVTVINGRNVDDPPTKVRQYLMVASCNRGGEGNEYWVCMTELVTGWRMQTQPIEVGKPTCTTEGMRQLGDAPTLYGFPERVPTNPERVEARKRIEAAHKRRNRGKRMFTPAMHERIGW